MPKCQVKAAYPFKQDCQNTVASKDMPLLTLMTNGMSTTIRVPVCEIHLPLLLRIVSDYHRGSKVMIAVKE